MRSDESERRTVDPLSTTITSEQIAIDVHLPPGGPLSGMAADVRAGLTKPFKELSPRYFYDERGSELFEAITELPEYYPTRAERAILERHAAAICATAAKPDDADRARLGLGEQDPRAPRRDGRGRLPRGIRAGGHLRADHARHRRGGCRRVRDRRARPRLRLRARPGADPARRAAGDRLPRRHDRELRAGPARQLPGAGREPARARRITSCSAPTWSRAARRSRPPTTTPPG